MTPTLPRLPFYGVCITFALCEEWGLRVRDSQADKQAGEKANGVGVHWQPGIFALSVACCAQAESFQVPAETGKPR